MFPKYLPQTFGCMQNCCFVAWINPSYGFVALKMRSEDRDDEKSKIEENLNSGHVCLMLSEKYTHRTGLLDDKQHNFCTLIILMAKFQSNDFDFEIWQCRHIKITETADKMIEIIFFLKTINIFSSEIELFCSDCKIFFLNNFLLKTINFSFALSCGKHDQK